MTSQDFSTPRRDRQQQRNYPQQEDAAVGTSMIFANNNIGRSPHIRLPYSVREQPMDEEMLLRGAHNRIVSKNSREVSTYTVIFLYKRNKIICF